MPTAEQWKPVDDASNRRARCHGCVNRVAGIFVCSLFISEWLTNRQWHRDEGKNKKGGGGVCEPIHCLCILHFQIRWEELGRECVYVTERKTEWESLLPSQWTGLVASPFTPGLVSTSVNPGNQ